MRALHHAPAPLAALALTALAACTTDPAATSCQTNRDCPTGQVCRANACVTPAIDGALPDGGTATDVGPVDAYVPPLTVTGWADAPELSPIELSPNRDSVVVHVPAVAGAQDYRVIVVQDDTMVHSSADGLEQVQNAVIFCAGRAQHAAPAATTPNEVMQVVEVTGLTTSTRIVVEAIDRECPFPGWLGTQDIDLPVLAEVQASLGVDATFPVRSPATMRSLYDGNLLYNAQGPGAVMARPAELGPPPRVLARAEVTAVPTGTDSQPMAFWEDWDDPSQTFADVGRYDGRPGQRGEHFQSARWNYYVYNLESSLLPSQVMIDRGRLVTYAADIAQDIFGAGMLTPREPVALASDTYVHVTFETSINATDRRYVWFSLCGPSTGSAYGADGSLQAGMNMEPFFYQPDGASPYAEDWNCLQVFGFEGSYYGAIGDDKADMSVRIILNRAQEASPGVMPTVLNVSPRQLDPTRDAECSWCGWYGEWNAAHELVRMPLDAMMHEAPVVRWDLWIRRDRVVLYVDGHQYACNDFPGTPLTMREGALGFGQVLYHTSAEHGDLLRDDWVRSAQRYYMTNAPWMDRRTWDNLGWQEGESLPADFDESLCFVSQRTFDDWTIN